jgi:DNA-binding MarR family transcriptional regulator
MLLGVETDATNTGGGPVLAGQASVGQASVGQASVGQASVGQASVGQASVGQALYGLISDAVRRIPRDMSLTSLSTLSTLDRTGPRRITDLAVIQGVAQPSMTTLVTGLQRSGFVERGADPADGRVALVQITPAGLAFMQARRHAGAEAFTDLIGKLPPAEVALLLAAVPALEHLRAIGNEQRDPSAHPAGPPAHPAGPPAHPAGPPAHPAGEDTEQ